MTYQGKIEENMSKKDIEKIYGFLKEALRAFDSKEPFRGPRTFESDGLTYIFPFKGDFSYFVGRESISTNGHELFFQNVMGSIIK